MKNLKFLGVLAMALVLSLSVFGCKDDPEPFTTALEGNWSTPYGDVTFSGNTLTVHANGTGFIRGPFTYDSSTGDVYFTSSEISFEGSTTWLTDTSVGGTGGEVSFETDISGDNLTISNTSVSITATGNMLIFQNMLVTALDYTYTK